MSKAVTEQFSTWSKLAKGVRWLLVLSILLSSAFVVGGFYLLDRQRIDGWQMAVLAFIFALTAISPATLLLIGRPLAGLDKWTPDAMFGGEKKEKDEGDKDKAALTAAADATADTAKNTKDTTAAADATAGKKP